LSLETLSTFVGNGAETLVRRSLAAARGKGERAEDVPERLVGQAMPQWHAAYAAHLLDNTRLYTGIGKIVGMQTIPQAVLTNKPGGYSRRILAGLGLAHAFPLVIGGDEAVRKPDPRGLLFLCEKLGVDPRDALMIGDSPIDVSTGKAARVPTCAVTWGFAKRAELLESEPAFFVDTAEELGLLLSQH
jgi:phosphoglycolate phosphatase